MGIKNNNIKYKLILSIIPLIILVGSSLLLIDLSAFYLSWLDPTYVYLFNGLNLAQGSLEIGHIDHPGTPLQIYCAIVIRIVYFFRNETDIVESVLSNPELYLYTISYSLILINVIILFIVGIIAFNASKKLSVAVFIQLTPFISYVSINNIPIITTESFLIAIGLLMVLLSFIYTFYNKKISKYSYVLFFSVLSALSVATKISSLPVIIIPLFLLNNYKFRIQYILLTIIFFFLFTIPIIDKFSHHYQFMLNIFTHTGIYGSGKIGFINTNTFFSNLILIFTDEFPFTFSYIIVFIISILLLFKIRYFNNIEIRKKRLLYGIFIATSLQILIVAKHYSFHYLVPAYNFSILGLFTVWNILQTKITNKYEQFRKPILVIVYFIIVIVFFTTRFVYSYKFYPNLNNPLNTTVNFIKKYKKTPKILLLDGNRENTFVETALNFGKVYSGSLKWNYAKHLKTKYPISYFYTSNKGLFDWQNNLMNEEVLSKNSKLLIYAKDKDSLRVNKSIKNITENTKKFVSISKIYSNKITYENIYELSIDTNSINKLIKLEKEIYCNMEVLGNERDAFINTNRQYFFEGANLQSTQHSISGKKSIKLSKDSPFGMKTSISVKKGNFIKIKVWSYSISNNGVIVASADKIDEFYKSSSSIIRTKNNWKLLELSFYVTQNLTNNKLNIYLWNSGNKDIYFDDLIIEEYTYE